jgi:peptidoglycan/xylan/chitin deacetylase (PgdA/CDA1 family)
LRLKESYKKKGASPERCCLDGHGQMRRVLLTLSCVVTLVLAGCNFPLSFFATQTPTPTLTPVPTNTPTPTITATQTATLSPTFTPEPTLTPTWLFNPKGEATVPVLLYHHVVPDDKATKDTCYCVSITNFQAQMSWLSEHGYTGIPVTQLVDVLKNGGQLPPRPVAITFDDGMQDIYTTAFPIMQHYGFSGTLFLIANWINGEGVMNTAEVQEMISNGWEIGSHSMTHFDLTSDYSQLRYQLFDSKHKLEDLFGVPVNTLAYPFGLFNNNVVDKVSAYGYSAAFALGRGYIQSSTQIFDLTREEVRESYDMSQFIALLPWQ